MRKRNQKPEIVFESFELSQSIAACFYKLNSTLEELCMTEDNGTWVDPGGFINEESCTYAVEDYCITNGVSDRVTYMS